MGLSSRRIERAGEAPAAGLKAPRGFKDPVEGSLHVVGATMRARLALVCIALLGALGCLGAGPAVAGATVPVEGPWHATLRDGLPIAFEVTERQITGLRFGFNTGFCGVQEGTMEAGESAPIGPEGEWRYRWPPGVDLSGTFVAPGRMEGVIWAPSRMGPSCPHFRATFVAVPGAAPFRVAETFLPRFPGDTERHQSPRRLDLRRDGSLHFSHLRWRGFGAATARAIGTVHVRRRGVLVRRKATLVVSGRIEAGPHYDTYEELRYVIHGPLPPGLPRRGTYRFT
jgi:hypothetical protein